MAVLPLRHVGCVLQPKAYCNPFSIQTWHVLAGH